MTARLILVVGALGLLLTGDGLAQTRPPDPTQTPNKAVNTTAPKTSDTPQRGANSFTEGQAKERMEKAGYNGISELKKSDDGVWRAKAIKSRTRVEVSLDYKGNVNERFLENIAD